MDPLTAALAFGTEALKFGQAVYADTPVEIRQQNAANWARFFQNIGEFVLQAQTKANAGLNPTAVAGTAAPGTAAPGAKP